MNSTVIHLRRNTGRDLVEIFLWLGMLLLPGMLPAVAGERVELIEAVSDASASELRQLQEAALIVLPGQGREVSRQRIFRFRWDLFENDVTRLSGGKVSVSFFADETCKPKKNRLVHRMSGFWNWSVVCREGDASFYLAIDIVNKRFSGVIRRGGVRSKIRSLDRRHGIVYTVK